jgi:hypothetical protein
MEQFPAFEGILFSACGRVLLQQGDTIRNIKEKNTGETLRSDNSISNFSCMNLRQQTEVRRSDNIDCRLCGASIIEIASPSNYK